MLRNFWLQPGNLGSATLFGNQERGKEAFWGKKTCVVSTVVVVDHFWEMFGVFF